MPRRQTAGQAALLAAPAAGLEFAILGPIRVLAGGQPLDLGPRKQQLVLAALLCQPNTAVPVTALAEVLWAGEPPRTARKNIQVYVWALRGLLGSGSSEPRISHLPGGYLLHVGPDELDALRFSRGVAAAPRLWQGERPAAVASALAVALALRRGPALAGMRDVPFLHTAALRLDRMFLAAFEDWADAELAAGGAARAIDRITELTLRHPARERLRMLQMRALHQLGRRSEALAAYDELRQFLAREYGLGPGEAAARLYQSLLHDAEPEPAASTAAAKGRPAVSRLLPPDLPAFTGRAEPARLLARAVTGNGGRLAVIAGAVGVGKTALAVHAAHRLGGRFPDGQFFLRLRDRSGAARPVAELLAELAWTASLAGWPGRRDDQDRAWQRWLAGRRALLVLDDAGHESQVRPLLPEVGDSAVIVTSRLRLAGLDSASRLWLSCFTLGEAVELLGRIIGPARVAANRPAAERIALATGLLPLGLRLVAERLAGLPHLTLGEYLARIERSPALLDELTAGDAAVRTRLAEAVRQMPGRARRAFRRLGSLEPLFTLGQAAAALGLAEDAAAQVLETLLEAGIITVPEAHANGGGVIYQMPALTFLYAREMAPGRPSRGHS